MRLSENNLREHTNAYVKDGRLLKYRFYGEEDTIHYLLHWKCDNKERLTKEEIEYIKTLGNVVIDTGGSMQFFNFTGVLTKWQEEVLI